MIISRRQEKTRTRRSLKSGIRDGDLCLGQQMVIVDLFFRRLRVEAPRVLHRCALSFRRPHRLQLYSSIAESRSVVLSERLDLFRLGELIEQAPRDLRDVVENPQAIDTRVDQVRSGCLLATQQRGLLGKDKRRHQHGEQSLAHSRLLQSHAGELSRCHEGIHRGFQVSLTVAYSEIQLKFLLFQQLQAQRDRRIVEHFAKHRILLSSVVGLHS